MRNVFTLIESNIVEYFISNNQLSIPGVGWFSKRVVNSDFKLSNDVLTPPTASIEFDEKSTDTENAFIGFLSQKQGVKPKEVKNQLTKYGQSLLNALLNYGTVDVKGLGRLYQDGANQIQFEPINRNYHSDYLFLPELMLKPLVVKTKEPVLDDQLTTTSSQAGVDKASTQIAKNNNPKVDKPVDLTPIVTAAAVPVTVALATNEALSISSDKDTPKVEEPRAKESSQPATINEKIAAKKELNSGSTTELNQKTDASIESNDLDTKYSTLNYDSYDEPSFWARWLWPILSLLIFIILCILLFKWCSSAIDTADTTVADVVETESTLGNEEILDENLEFQKLVANDPILSKYQEFLTPQILETGCVIIIGSFTKSTNAVRLKQRVISAGLEPYTEVYQDFTRVGLRFECADHDLIEKLKDIRDQFNGKAWYLYPEMKVPY